MDGGKHGRTSRPGRARLLICCHLARDKVWQRLPPVPVIGLSYPLLGAICFAPSDWTPADHVIMLPGKASRRSTRLDKPGRRSRLSPRECILRQTQNHHCFRAPPSLAQDFSRYSDFGQAHHPLRIFSSPSIIGMTCPCRLRDLSQIPTRSHPSYMASR